MSAPGSTAVLLPTGAVPRDDHTVIEALLGGRDASTERIGTGRNSRVYRVCCDGEEYVAKLYFGVTADGRDRLQVEFSALQFLWFRGVRCIPHPLCADPARKVALYAFVAGEPVDITSASAADVEQLISFLRVLRQIGSDPEARVLPPAAEAFFTIADVVANIRARLERLQTHDGEDSAYTTLRLFLRDTFSHALDRFAARAGVTKTSVITAALEAYLEAHDTVPDLPFLAVGRSDHGRLSLDGRAIARREAGQRPGREGG